MSFLPLFFLGTKKDVDGFGSFGGGLGHRAGFSGLHRPPGPRGLPPCQGNGKMVEIGFATDRYAFLATSPEISSP